MRCSSRKCGLRRGLEQPQSGKPPMNITHSSALRNDRRGQLDRERDHQSGLQRERRAYAIKPTSAPRGQDVGAQGPFKVSSAARCRARHRAFARLGQRRRNGNASRERQSVSDLAPPRQFVQSLASELRVKVALEIPATRHLAQCCLTPRSRRGPTALPQLEP